MAAAQEVLLVNRELQPDPVELAYHGSHIAPISCRGDFAVGPHGEIRERKYDAFVQLLIKRGNKIAAVSFPLPLGTTPEMGQEILRRTLYPQEEFVPAVSFGEKKELRAMIRMGRPLDVLERFIQAAEDVITAEHPKKKHRAVSKFYRDQLIRHHFLSQTQQDVDEILENETFLHKSAWRDENKGKRIFVMEHFVDPKTGELLGVGPAPEYKVFPIRDLAIHQEYRDWLSYYDEFAAMVGDGVLGHVDGGPTVDGGGSEGYGCAGSKRCSVFFDEMEEDPMEKVFDLATGTTIDRMMDLRLRALLSKKDEDEKCKTCQKAIDKCDGHTT